jgi:chromosome segregation ATPase
MGDLTTPPELARERLLLQIAEQELLIARGHRRLLEIARKDRPDAQARLDRATEELARLDTEDPEDDWSRAKVEERRAELRVQVRAQQVRLVELAVEEERLRVAMEAARAEIARLQSALTTLDA